MQAKLTSFLQLMRLHQPTGIWLLLWPCWWAIALASTYYPDSYLLVLFLLGAIIMRGAGCVINDIIDKDIDRKVARTKNRPIASGKITVTEALVFLCFLLLLGLIILLQLNRTTIILGVFSLIPIIFYPFVKRIFSWPQLVLGLTFNWGAIMGWSAVDGKVTLSTFVLYLAAIAWTIGYDSIYALQDIKDDKKIGVKSTVISWGRNAKKFIGLFYTASIALFLLLGLLEGFWVLYFAFVVAAATHFFWQLHSLNIKSPEDCMRVFRSNTGFGWIIFLGIVCEKLLYYFQYIT